MFGILEWFKAKNKLKRWMLLIAVGIVGVCFGIAKILVMKEISFEEVGIVALMFVVGFVFLILGLVFINKRTLEILVEATDDRMQNKKNVNINHLIFNKKVYDEGPKIVAIGGGTGLNTVLSGLKNYTSNITAIATVSDYGEEQTIYRKSLNIKPIDDITGSIVSLSNNDKVVDRLFNHKFQKGSLKGFQFSDIYFAAMQEICSSFEISITKNNEVINMVGKVVPVTLDEMEIQAELENGYVIKEKTKIQEMVTEKFTKINRIKLSPSNIKVAPGVIEAIKEADCIIIGPGSLYTNVIPNLLVNGVAKAIKESSAIKVYVSNIMTEPGQTDDYSVSDHLKAIIDHCGTGIVDYCIYDTGEIIPEIVKQYNLEGQDLVIPDIQKIKGIKFLQRDLATVAQKYIRHDPALVANSVIELICDDLKYQDKQNDPQYMMLNNKLREDKRIEKVKKNMAKKAKKKKQEPVLKSKSKFSTKYSARIASIKEADLKVKKPKVKKVREERRRKTSQQIREEMIKMREQQEKRGN